MPGERTPDTSPSTKYGSSDDQISLREHMQRQIEDQRRYTERLHEEQNDYFQRVIVETRAQLDERYATQTKALDAALVAAEKAVQAALDAAKEAVGKAELASDKRFESVNEFRAQLADQARTFMGRDESISRHERTTEMITAQSARYETEARLLRERFEQEVKNLRDRHEVDMAVVNSRLDLGQGRATGTDKTIAWIFAAAGFVGTVIAIVIATR